MTDRELFEDAKAAMESELDLAGTSIQLSEETSLQNIQSIGFTETETAIRNTKNIVCEKHGIVSCEDNSVRYVSDLIELVTVILESAVIEGDIEIEDISTLFRPTSYGYFYTLEEALNTID